MAEGISTTSKRETTFLDLNDDCLMEVFSWMLPLDLCTVRNLCSRLKKLTEDYFGQKHNLLHFSSTRVAAITGSDCEMDKNELMKLLSSFGQQIDVLIVNAHCFPHDYEELPPKLDDFCKKHSLQHLKLVRFSFDEDFLRSRSHPFPNVGKLTLDKCSCDTGSLDDLVKKCTTLRHLELLRDTLVYGSFLEQNYPMLQGFNINSIHTLDPELLKTFVAMNPQLKDLHIVNCCGLNDGIFQVIGDHLGEVESLTLRSVQNSLQYNTRMMELLNLPKLRELEIECNYRENVAFLDGLSRKNEVESLGLASVTLTEAMSNALGQLKSVEKLKLVSILKPDNSGSIQSISVQLPLLKQFYVSSSESLIFDDVVKFVENAPKLEDLMITSCSSITPFDEAQFNRLVETCAKRTDKRKLTVHFDYAHFCELKRAISGEMRRNNSEVVRFVELPPEVKDFTAFDEPSGYFAEEGGALDYDFMGDVLDAYDDDAGDYDEYDDHDDHDGYDDHDDCDDDAGDYDEYDDHDDHDDYDEYADYDPDEDA